MRAFDEHVKLARASLDFYPDLDSAFGVNVAKARVILPAALRERLRTPVEDLVRRAQSIYRQHPSSSGGTSGGSHGIVKRGKSRSATVVGARKALEAAAKDAREERAFKRIVKALKKVAPEVARALGW